MLPVRSILHSGVDLVHCSDSLNCAGVVIDGRCSGVRPRAFATFFHFVKTMDRHKAAPLCNAFLNAGAVATAYALALIMFQANFWSLAQDGSRPHRSTVVVRRRLGGLWTRVSVDTPEFISHPGFVSQGD